MSVGGSRSDIELHKKFKKTRVDSCLGVDWICTLGSPSPRKLGFKTPLHVDVTFILKIGFELQDHFVKLGGGVIF